MPHATRKFVLGNKLDRPTFWDSFDLNFSQFYNQPNSKLFYVYQSKHNQDDFVWSVRPSLGPDFYGAIKFIIPTKTLPEQLPEAYLQAAIKGSWSSKKPITMALLKIHSTQSYGYDPPFHQLYGPVLVGLTQINRQRWTPNGPVNEAYDVNLYEHIVWGKAEAIQHNRTRSKKLYNYIYHLKETLNSTLIYFQNIKNEVPNV